MALTLVDPCVRPTPTPVRRPTDDPDVNTLLTRLRNSNEGESTRPVRIFTIAYGKDADLGVLRRIAESTNAAAYDASDPTSINQVFTAVISNF